MLQTLTRMESLEFWEDLLGVPRSFAGAKLDLHFRRKTLSTQTCLCCVGVSAAAGPGEAADASAIVLSVAGDDAICVVAAGGRTRASGSDLWRY
jgi:hypothetical protein